MPNPKQRLSQLTTETERTRKATLAVLEKLSQSTQDRYVKNEVARAIIILLGQGVATKLIKEEFLNE